EIGERSRKSKMCIRDSACTVVVGELDGERVRYRTLNSCLTFVSSLHGKQLITVEDLKHQGQLHSVQPVSYTHLRPTRRTEP
ncbi:hypothetical protein ACQ4LH_21720, partial [Pseudomonas peli]